MANLLAVIYRLLLWIQECNSIVCWQMGTVLVSMDFDYIEWNGNQSNPGLCSLFFPCFLKSSVRHSIRVRVMDGWMSGSPFGDSSREIAFQIPNRLQFIFGVCLRGCFPLCGWDRVRFSELTLTGVECGWRWLIRIHSTVIFLIWIHGIIICLNINIYSNKSY